MDKLCKEYSTFLIFQMDEEALTSFTLPFAIDPIESPAKFSKICFIFLLPQDSMQNTSEMRLPISLRRQLYRPGPHIHPNEVDIEHPDN